MESNIKLNNVNIFNEARKLIQGEQYLFLCSQLRFDPSEKELGQTLDTL